MTNKISKNWLKYLLVFIFILFILAIPLVKQAKAVELTNPLCEHPPDPDNPAAKASGPCIQDVGALIIRIITFILGGLGIFGVFMVIYGGFLFLIAGGNEETIKKAKATLVWAVIGMAIILGSRIIVGFVATTLNPGITTHSLEDVKVTPPGQPNAGGIGCASLGMVCKPLIGDAGDETPPGCHADLVECPGQACCPK